MTSLRPELGDWRQHVAGRWSLGAVCLIPSCCRLAWSLESRGRLELAARAMRRRPSPCSRLQSSSVAGTYCSPLTWAGSFAAESQHGNIEPRGFVASLAVVAVGIGSIRLPLGHTVEPYLVVGQDAHLWRLLLLFGDAVVPLRAGVVVFARLGNDFHDCFQLVSLLLLLRSLKRGSTFCADSREREGERGELREMERNGLRAIRHAIRFRKPRGLRANGANIKQNPSPYFATLLPLDSNPLG